MSRALVIVLCAAGIVAGVIGYAALQIRNDEVVRENRDARLEQQKYFPPGLECAPSFRDLDSALEHAIGDALDVDVRVRVRAGGPTVELETSKACDADVLGRLRADRKVERLLRHCAIARLECIPQKTRVDLTW